MHRGDYRILRYAKSLRARQFLRVLRWGRHIITIIIIIIIIIIIRDLTMPVFGLWVQVSYPYPYS